MSMNFERTMELFSENDHPLILDVLDNIRISLDIQEVFRYVEPSEVADGHTTVVFLFAFNVLENLQGYFTHRGREFKADQSKLDASIEEDIVRVIEHVNPKVAQLLRTEWGMGD